MWGFALARLVAHQFVHQCCLWLIFFVFLFPIESKSAQDAIVSTDGAIVYSQPDFDSPVMGYLRQGQKIRMSNRTIGAFFRMNFNNQIGYIADVDVKPENATAPSPSDTSFETGETSEPPSPTLNRNQILNPHFGPFVAYIFSLKYVSNFNVSHLEEYLDSNFFSFGVKFNFFQVWDTSLHLSLEPPQGYERNFSVFLDIQYLFLLDSILKDNAFLFVGIGPAISYWDLVSQPRQDSQGNEKIETISGISVNALISLHLSFYISSFVLRLEPRYYFGRATYYSLAASLQKVF